MPIHRPPTFADSLNWLNPVNRDAPLNRGLVAWWKAFQGQPGWKSSRWLDLMDPLYGNHGTLTNMDPASAWSGVSHPGGWGSLDFDGTDDVVSCGNVSIGGLTEITVGAWMFADGTGEAGFGRVVGKNDGTPISIEITAATTMRWKVEGVNLDATVTYQGGWHHLACVFSSGVSGGKQIYFDGIAVASGTQTATLTTNANPLLIGNRAGTDRTFDGRLDDLFIYSRALSPSEVFARYQQSLAGDPDLLNWQRRMTVFDLGGGVVDPTGRRFRYLPLLGAA